MDRSFRYPLILVIVATLLAWGVWFATVAKIDPGAAGVAGFVVFYCALFAAMAGSATIIGLYARRRAASRNRAIGIALRQGILAGLAVTVAAFLQSQQLLTWLNIVFLIAALTLLELFLVSLRRNAFEYESEYESDKSANQ